MKLLRRSKLPTDNTEFKPLHCDRNYDLFNRKLKKLVAKTTWYDDVIEKNSPSWRSTLPKKWLGDKPVQVKVHGLKYSTLLQVPNSKGGRLIKSLARAEHRLATNTRYQVKLIEKSGKPLSKSFNKDISLKHCHREWYAVCTDSNSKGPTKCGIKSVVYSGICDLCEKNSQIIS